MKMPSKEQILEASKDCPDAKEVLGKLFPEAFKEEKKKEKWENITEDIEAIIHVHCDGTATVRLYDGAYRFGYVAGEVHICIDDQEKYKTADSDFFFRILKRRGK